MLDRVRLTLIAGVITVMTATTALLLVNHAKHQEQETVFLPENLIRLHIIANSDSRQDQELKREIRDEIVRFMAPQMLPAENAGSARMIAAANLEKIRQIAERKVNDRGGDYQVNVELGRFSFPTKHYGPFILPAGEYEALQVVIGAGGGANWWCVLFPPLCFVDMSKAVTPVQAEDDKQIPANSIAIEEPTSPALEIPEGGDSQPDTAGGTGITVVYRFKILDILQKLK